MFYRYCSDVISETVAEARLTNIKVFLKTQHIQLVDYKEKLVTKLVDEITVKDESIEVKLKSGEMISVER